MALKNNHGTFRYSDRVAEILDSFEGRSRNEKLENMVLYCFDEAPRQEKRLEIIRKDIESEQKQYLELVQKLQNVHSLIQTLETLEHYSAVAERMAQKVAEDFQAEAEPEPAKPKRTAAKKKCNTEAAN